MRVRVFETFRRRGRSAALGAVLSVLLGLALARLPLGDGLVWLSYDLAFAFRPATNLTEALIIGIDEKSLNELRQKPGHAFDRHWHAELLQRLASSRLVIFDVQLAGDGAPATDQELARAIQTHGRVVLAAAYTPLASEVLVGGSIIKANDLFQTNALGWGLAQRDRDADNVSRRHYAGTSDYPSLAWAAATLAGAPVTRLAAQAGPEGARIRLAERWLNYYGPDAIRIMSYVDALHTNQPPELFQDKVVFVGHQPLIQHPRLEEDEAPTPFTRWTRRRAGGVELVATTFLNLSRGDWLNQMPAGLENWLLVLTGLLFGGGLRWLRPWPAAAAALGGMLLAGTLGILLVWTKLVWFSWAVLAVAQIPLAFLYALVSQTTLLSDQVRALRSGAVESPGTKVAEGEPLRIEIPNCTLLRQIGKGAYGEVWLVRNAVGLHFAVKIVRRDKFNDETPYEREFHGIERYMPVSMSHPGLLQILHVGRDDAQGYFFYIMELADDEVIGQQTDPARYAPKSLASELRHRGALPPEESVSLMLHLTLALDHLHRQGRIHRDIKPANIIYVRGTPKFADIGLVTDIPRAGAAVTYLGTEGYIAPEGPGTVAATCTASAWSCTWRARDCLRNNFPNCRPRPSKRPAPSSARCKKSSSRPAKPVCPGATPPRRRCVRTWRACGPTSIRTTSRQLPAEALIQGFPGSGCWSHKLQLSTNVV